MEKVSEELLKNEFLAIVSAIAVETGVAVYFVGGGLRDMLTGRKIKDIDFALESRPEEISEIFARRIGGTFFWLNKERLQARVVKKDRGSVMTFDFAPLRGNDIIQDLSVRDFTINAFAVSLTDEKASIIDPHNGLNDLRQCVIKACSEDSFDHDPLRLLRAIRFAAIFGFSIEPETWRKICDKAHLLRRVAPERIRTEFFQILDASDAASALGKLLDSALIHEIVPFSLCPDKCVSSAMRQLIKCLTEVEGIIADPAHYFPDVGEDIRDYLGREVESAVTMASLVKLALFLGCQSHAVVLASATAYKLKLGCKARRVLEILCGKIVQTSSLTAWKPTERAIYRFFKDSEPAGPGALIIALALQHLSQGLCASMARYYFTGYQNVWDESFLSGEEIMAILHTGPGRMVGKAMELLRDAESAGLVNNKAEALAYLGKNLLTKEETVI